TFLYTDGLATSTDSVSRIVNANASASTASGADTAGEAIQIIYGPPTTSPIISLQPTNRSATLGSISTFTVVAGSIAPVFYQWFFTDTNNPISNATNASLILTNLQQNQA